jgi:HK97 family phage prohead protease
MLMPGAFRRTLGEGPDVVLLLGHGDAGAGLPLARTTAGTLSLVEDKVGLFFTANLDPADPDSQTLARKLARGDLDGQASFAFIATDQQWNEDFTKRKVTSVGLHKGDVSVVAFGANDKTSTWIAEPAPRAARRKVVRVDYTSAARRDYEAMKRGHR